MSLERKCLFEVRKVYAEHGDQLKYTNTCFSFQATPGKAVLSFSVSDLHVSTSYLPW